ncbi:MAG: response regulator [Comamonas sp.]|nr:response regulator [Comamonas sp.]
MTPQPSPPCVLLLEDDPSVQRFVQLALEELPLQLHCCTSVALARDLLRTLPVQLLLSDLHLPDGSGLALCQELQATASRPAPLIVVFSGGVDALLEQQLRRSGVWQVLHKPVPLGQLVQCVEQALAGPLYSNPPDSHTTAATDPVHTFFNGNQALFAAYRETCLQQFRHDLVAGDSAAHQGDYAALRHLGHSLKSVLSMLGQPLSAQLARTLEEKAHTGEPETAMRIWQDLRDHLKCAVDLENI